MQKHRLALVMIARNEARCIGRALESAASAVDRMIVLDTGSADDTRDIAGRCGAEVFAFDWVDDFAAARNAALAHSSADWNLILDADEWLEGDLSALGAASLPASPAEPFLGHLLIAHQTDDGGHLRGWTPRVLPRDTAYEGRIHEQPVTSAPNRRLNLRVSHDGFLAERRKAKSGRNEALLLAELTANPCDGFSWFALGREKDVAGKAQQAALCYINALRLAPLEVSYRHRLVVRSITALKESSRLVDAQRLVREEIDRYADSPDFFFAVGDLYLEMASQDPAKALSHHLPVAQNAWARCLEIGERADLDGSIAGRGGYMAAHNLALCYDVMGKADLAQGFRELAESLRGQAA